MEKIDNSDLGMEEFRKKIGRDETGITKYREPVPANWKYKATSSTVSKTTRCFQVIALATIGGVIFALAWLPL